MKITITTHYNGTTNGVIVDGHKLGGTFYPEGEGTVAKKLTVSPVGRLKFDPDTGAPIPNELAGWEGSECKVRLLERAGGNGTRCVPVAWISAVDVQGTEHTAEFVLEPGLVAAFGFVSLTVD